MMDKRFKTNSAVMLLLFRTAEGRREVLLQRRRNTGYADGMWDCAASGHVEANESMKMAVIREAGEELGIGITMNELEFATITHKYTPETGNTYYNAYFIVIGYTGRPEIMEPHKCSQLKWFGVDALPADLLPDRGQAIRNYLAHIPYDECGWDRRRDSD